MARNNKNLKIIKNQHTQKFCHSSNFLLLQVVITVVFSGTILVTVLLIATVCPYTLIFAIDVYLLKHWATICRYSMLLHLFKDKADLIKLVLNLI